MSAYLDLDDGSVYLEVAGLTETAAARARTSTEARILRVMCVVCGVWCDV